MDEGFCTYAQYEVLNYLKGTKVLNPLSRQYRSYIRLANSEYQEPLSTHADFYKLNYAYGVSAYNKGSVFLHQLGYVIGDQVIKNGMKKYFNQWKFKHPHPRDFKKIMEIESGLELDWYFEQFTQTINTIDYSIENVKAENSFTKVTLKRNDDMPMPLDICVKTIDGEIKWFNIPLRIMRGHKSDDMIGDEVKILSDWPWVYENYEFTIDIPLPKIEEIRIDPSTRMADVNPEDNSWQKESLEKNNPIIFKDNSKY
jgi:hypothetical protein